MIEVKGILKRFGDNTALDGLSLTAENSSIYGIVGCNGAGKTTLLKTAAGIYRPESGEVLIDGEKVYENEAVKRRLFSIPDEIYILPQASLDRMASFYRGYYPAWNEKTYAKLSSLFKLSRKARLSGFSKGMQRQAEIVLALSTQPAALLLDESFDGLDPMIRELVKKLLLEYIAEKEASIVISSHNLPELEALCDHIGFINGKKLSFESSIDDLRQNRCKFRAAFSQNITEKNFEGIPYKHYKQEGRIATFIAGDVKNTEAKLRAMSPALLEMLPMTLEEIFLDEMEVRDYDVGNIF